MNPLVELPFISVVIPVKNDAALLRRCLDSFVALEYPEERREVIIADGRSTDDTRAVAIEFGAVVVENAGEIVSSGRNRGFSVAKGELVAFTDADCVFDRKWLLNSVPYFADPQVAGIGGLTLPPKDHTDFERAINMIFRFAEFIHVTAHRQSKDVPKKVRDVPGCNAVYRKSALALVMPVDENLLTAEDVWMNRQLAQKGFTLVYAPTVVLWHYRRNDPRKFFRQVYRFAIGRLQVGKRDWRLLSILHVCGALVVPVACVMLAWLMYAGYWVACALVAVSLAVLAGVSLFSRLRALTLFGNIVVVAAIFFTAWSVGFFRELCVPLKEAKGK